MRAWTRALTWTRPSVSQVRTPTNAKPVPPTWATRHAIRWSTRAAATPISAAASSAASSAPGSVSGGSIQAMPSAPNLTATAPAGRCNVYASRPRSCASTQAVPSVGCPAKGSSCAGVKMRTSARSSSSASTNVVSERFISRAMSCICSTERCAQPRTTASGLPASGRSANTSTIVQSMVGRLEVGDDGRQLAPRRAWPVP